MAATLEALGGRWRLPVGPVRQVLGGGAASVPRQLLQVPTRGLITCHSLQVTRSFSLFLPPPPEEHPRATGQVLPVGTGRAQIRLCLLVFLEEHASWRCGVWEEPSHLAEGTGKACVCRVCRQDCLLAPRAPRQTLFGNTRLLGRRRKSRPGFPPSPRQGPDPFH